LENYQGLRVVTGDTLVTCSPVEHCSTETNEHDTEKVKQMETGANFRLQQQWHERNLAKRNRAPRGLEKKKVEK
jgi:BioD-like phosphotransacetylase family protein